MNQLQAYGYNFHTDHLALMTLPVDCYTDHVKTFAKWIRETGRSDIIGSVADYFRDLNHSSYSAGTVRMKRQAVKARLLLIADSEITDLAERYRFDLTLSRLDRDPDTKAPKLNSVAVKPNKVISRTEYRDLLERCTERQRLFIRFLWTTGCRVSEMTGIKHEHCTIEDGAVNIRVRGKGNKERYVRIPLDLYQDIVKTFSGTGYLYHTSAGKQYRRSYVSDQIAKVTLRVLGRRLSAHCLRHTFATRKIADTHKVSAVSEYLGHSDISTTLAMYNHESLTDVELFN